MSTSKTKVSEFFATPEELSMLHDIRQRGPVSICFFNNKGGVGKTTLVANLAANLALNYEAKVLVVDADPQCNLTQYVLEEGEFLDLYSSKDPKRTVYSIIHPLSIGKGYREKLPVHRAKNFSFDVVVGDPRLALKEDLLAQHWRDAKAGGTRGLRTTFLFADLIEKAKGYDFVFFDMGPSLGAINRSILLSVDGFIVPMSIDIFSMLALQNIGSAVKAWSRELKFGVSMAEDPEELPNSSKIQKKLRFFGYVMQQHKERSENGTTKVVEAYERIKRDIPGYIEKSLVGLYDKNIINPHLGDIKHLASLAPKSQTQHTPMISVKAVGSYTSSRKKAREIFKEISSNLIENISVTVC